MRTPRADIEAMAAKLNPVQGAAMGWFFSGAGRRPKGLTLKALSRRGLVSVRMVRRPFGRTGWIAELTSKGIRVARAL